MVEDSMVIYSTSWAESWLKLIIAIANSSITFLIVNLVLVYVNIMLMIANIIKISLPTAVYDKKNEKQP